MECNICKLETNKLYIICSTCNLSKICKKCITNLEKHKLFKCPFCRTKLDCHHIYYINKCYFHRILIFLILSIILTIEYIIPIYLLYNYTDNKEIYWDIKKLTVNIFILKGLTCWLYYKYNRITNNYLPILLFTLSFIASSTISFFMYYNIIESYLFIFRYYTSLVYEIPCYSLIILLLADYAKQNLKNLSINNYKKYNIKYINIEDTVYIDTVEIQTTGL